MSTFETDIWAAGLQSTKTDPRASNANSGIEDKDREKSGSTSLNRPPLPAASAGTGGSSSKGRRAGAALYRIFKPSGQSGSDSDGSAVLGHSRRYNSDSEFESSGDDSDAASVSNMEVRGSVSTLPRLSSTSLFTKKKKKAAVDSDSESEVEPDLSLSRRTTSKLSLFNKNSRKASIATNDGNLSSSSSKLDASDKDSSDGEHAPQEKSNNIFKNILSAKKRPSAVERVTSPTKTSSPVLGGAASSSVPRLGSTTANDGPSRSNSISSEVSLSRSGSESSLSEKYGPTMRKEVGRGASAVVRLCSPVNSDKKFAIKEFKPRRKGESQKEYIKKVTSEFCISSSMEHENIVKTIDLIEDEHKKWCVVMEFSSGGDLFSKISMGLLVDKPELVNCFFKQLLRGVSYLHSMGVAHRDLKPENLLLDATCRIVKITDFGVSDVFRPPLSSISKKSVGQVGSGPYIAPEIFTQREYSAEMMDVWACGIIYYVMIHNSVPWAHANSNDSRFKHFRENRAKFWPILSLPPYPRKMMFAILEPDVSQRIKMAAIMSDEWIKSIECCETGMPAEASGHSHACLVSTRW